MAIRGFIVVGAACAILGVGAGIALSRVSPKGPIARVEDPAPPATATRNDTVVVPHVTATLGEDDRTALRALVREELQAARTSDPHGVPSAEPSDRSAPVVPPAALPAFDQARSRIDGAVQRGTWTLDDRDRLREEFGLLPADVRMIVVRPLIVAVNDSRVHFEGHGPLF
jgi:hypothetical protein